PRQLVPDDDAIVEHELPHAPALGLVGEVPDHASHPRIDPMSTHAIFRVPDPYNEPAKNYAPGSPERAELQQRLREMESQQLDIPLVIGGEEVRTGETFEAVEPHKRSHV